MRDMGFYREVREELRELLVKESPWVEEFAFDVSFSETPNTTTVHGSFGGNAMDNVLFSNLPSLTKKGKGVFLASVKKFLQDNKESYFESLRDSLGDEVYPVWVYTWLNNRIS